MAEHLPDGKVADCRSSGSNYITVPPEEVYFAWSEDTSGQALDTAPLDELAQAWKIEDIKAHADYHTLEVQAGRRETCRSSKSSIVFKQSRVLFFAPKAIWSVKAESEFGRNVDGPNIAC